MPRQIDLPDVYSQLVGDFLRRPFFAHVAIENLKLFWIDLLFGARNRCLKQIVLPFRFPDRIQIDDVRVRHAFDRCGETIIRNVRTFRSSRLAFPKLIDDPPARDLQEPSFKRTNRRIVFQFVDLLRHRDDGFLHDRSTKLRRVAAKPALFITIYCSWGR